MLKVTVRAGQKFLRWKKLNSGFNSNPLFNYANETDIGLMNIICSHCKL